MNERKRTCKECGHVGLEAEDFPRSNLTPAGTQTYRNVCKPCFSAAMTEKKKTWVYCAGCKLTRPPTKWIGPDMLKLHTLCVDCSGHEDSLWRLAVRDIKYDYAFAKDVLGWSTDDAVKWICTGYGLSEHTIRKYRLVNACRTQWQPDPVVPLEPRTCLRCQETKPIDEFNFTKNKQGKQYRKWECAECSAAKARARREREKGAPVRYQRTKVKV